MAYGALKRKVALNDHAAPIRTRRQPSCHVCGSAGEVLYEGLRDRLFGVPGEWTLRRCCDESCGLLWLDPMPAEEDLPRLYGNYYTHSGDRKPTRVRFLREMIKRVYWRATYGPVAKRSRVLPGILALAPALRAQLALQVFDLPYVEGGRLLDVGCGSGAAMTRMRDLGWKVEGVDFDAAAVKVACSCGLEVHPGTLEKQRYPSDAFDAVVMSHVLEHVPDPSGLLQECLRILKPRGRLVCITPNASSLCHQIFKCDWRGLEPPRHLHIFTASSLHRLAESVEWDFLSIKSTIANSHGMLLVSRRMSRGENYDKPFTVYEALGARIFQISVYFRSLYENNLGEELIMHATKKAST